jgi:polysaccharide export outer membrane protein
MRNQIVLSLVLACVASPSYAQFVTQALPGPAVVNADGVDANALLQSLLHAPYPKTVLRVDDTISVKVYGVKDYDLQARINADGTVRLPLIGDVPTAGFTIEELEKAIQTKLENSEMITSPQVTVSSVALPSQIVTVSGDAARPGVFSALGQLNLMDYLSLAGGLNRPTSLEASPSSSTITLIRPSLAAPVTIALGSDPKSSPYARLPIFAGDEIRVAKTGMIYTVGAFHTQGAFPLKSSGPTTVTDLIALAGGIGFEADYADAHIVRAVSNGHVLVSLNVNKILKGKAPDLVLQPDDILFLPTSLMKAAIKGGGAGIIAGFATAYIYRF